MIIINVLLVYTLAIIIYSIIFMFYPYEYWNGLEKKNDTNIYDKIINRLYFISSTISTVGYGDITPKTNSLKLIIISLHMFLIVGVFEILIDGMRK